MMIEGDSNTGRNNLKKIIPVLFKTVKVQILNRIMRYVCKPIIFMMLF